MTKFIVSKAGPDPIPATNAELIAAVNGLRIALDSFASLTSSNLEWLTQGLQARLDAADQRRLHLVETGTSP
jgi:hypothetical protein